MNDDAALDMACKRMLSEAVEEYSDLWTPEQEDSDSAVLAPSFYPVQIAEVGPGKAVAVGESFEQGKLAALLAQTFAKQMLMLMVAEELKAGKFAAFILVHEAFTQRIPKGEKRDPRPLRDQPPENRQTAITLQSYTLQGTRCYRQTVKMGKPVGEFEVFGQGIDGTSEVHGALTVERALGVCPIKTSVH